MSPLDTAGAVIEDGHGDAEGLERSVVFENRCQRNATLKRDEAVVALPLFDDVVNEFDQDLAVS